MKKKIFTLLTLLLCLCSGAWADEEIIFSWSGSSSRSAKVTSETNDYGTIAGFSDGGNSTTAQLVNVSKSGFYVLDLGSGNSDFSTNVIKITLKTGVTLKEGDKLTVNGFSSKGDKDSYPSFKFSSSYIYTFNTTPFANLNSSSPNYNDGDLKEAQEITLGSGAEGITEFLIARGNQGTGFWITSVVITRESSKVASDLTVKSGKENIILAVDDTYTLTKNTDFTTSSTGAITFASSNSDIATVNETTGLITAKAVGTATITLSQAADESYLAKNISFTINVQSPLSWSTNYGVPEGKLDLSDADAASTMLNKTWHSDYGRPLFGNDGENNYLTYSMVGVFSSTSTQTWAKAASAQTNTTSWSAPGVFKGYEKYMTTARASSVQSGQDHCYYAFRISGVNKAQVLAKSNSNNVTVTMAAFELTGSTPAENTMLYGTCGNTESIISLNLDDTKDYVIILTNSGSTNSRLFEMALFYDKDVQLYEAITPANEKSTYVTTNAVDFTKADGITAYVATGRGTNKVVMTPVDAPVPAKTPLMLIKKSGTTFNIPVATEAEAPTTNYLKAGPYDFTGEETDKYFLSTDGKFHWASEGTLAAGKAYLDLEGVSASRVLSISFSDDETTGIEAVNVNTESNNAAREYYNLNGQRVANPTKGLYIVNGKKVIMK